MTRITLTILALSISAISFSQGLESNAAYIKKNYPAEYSNTIRKHAIEKWADDHNMVVYEINKQANSLFELVNAFEPDNTNIAFKAILKWSHEGYESSNSELFKKLKIFDVKGLIKLHCDWSMVMYEYEKQAEAKSAY